MSANSPSKRRASIRTTRTVRSTITPTHPGQLDIESRIAVAVHDEFRPRGHVLRVLTP